MKKLKYIFASVSFLLLVFMLLMSRDAGVNCDEVLHYNQSVAVLDFFATHGRDTSALDTPVTHLKYYGQSYDNITTVLIRILGIEDIYGFRHLMSAIAGWATIMVAAMLAIWLEGYWAGIITVLLFAVSATFLGHSQNNLKDIPFALAYISGIYFIFRFLSGKKGSIRDILFLILSIGFCISIRAGGLILICYLLLFFGIIYILRYYRERSRLLHEAGIKLLLIIFISAAALVLGILLWPYALLDPIKNVMNSYRIMAHFPDTFRQIFEGKAEWSDFMPWYYLPKSMLITIPLLVTAGIVLFFIFINSIRKGGKIIYYLLLLVSILFPVVLVIISHSNLYSGWRHFLFIYPGLVVISATGILSLFRCIKPGLISYLLLALLLIMAIHPVGFMIRNHRYAYIYYNQLVGGIQGAFGNYETDYYFVSQRQSAEWLVKYLEEKGIRDTVIVGSNFSAEWYFRKQPLIKNRYIRFEERSMSSWDYAIITNRYIPPFQLKNHLWPPADALYTVTADGVPISAVIKRKSEASLLGLTALEAGKPDEAARYFTDAIKEDSFDDMIFYNFAVALFRKGEVVKADSMLKECLKLNPGSDLALMFLGDIASVTGRDKEAGRYYEDVIAVNRKYPEAYISLAKIVARENRMGARELLRSCIEISPGNVEAINALADTYRESDPEIARKYYDMAKSIK